jgi:hypothetical protein
LIDEHAREPGWRGREGEDLREEEAHCNPVLRIRTLRILIQDGKAGKDRQTGGGTLSHTHAEVPDQVP